MKTAQELYNATIKGSPRSKEWKLGAMAGLSRREAPHIRQFSPFASGTAQDDAWAAGLQYGLQVWTWSQEEEATA